MTCFDEEINKTINDIKLTLEEDELCFAMFSDTNLSDCSKDTCEHINAIDRAVEFDFVVHLGNIIDGTVPRKISGYLLKSELKRYKECIGKNKLFVSQGDKDGWRDERFLGQLALSINTDEFWYENTNFIDIYSNVSRIDGQPYYYVDFPDKNIRLIFLCSYHYQLDSCIGYYRKYTDINAKQANWLLNEALDKCEGKTVILFSHKIPSSCFEVGEGPYSYNGFSTDPIYAIIQGAQRRGVNIACWFGGGYGYDCEIRYADINLAVINSQFPQIVKEGKCDNLRFADNRDMNTVNQDCFDIVVVKEKLRKIYIYRFGCGDDRVIEW